ncbi:MAG: DUF4430 domain-containing protein [Ruminococcaceae bacterium]|nr:DUF4430 domain-containing protein [Oscillospiraceae bacterium]
MTKLKRILSVLLVLALTAAACMSFAGCKKPTGNNDEKTITVTVVDDKGEKTVFTITTNSPNLRGALEQEKLVEGDESEYGLYVKVVNGLRADYDKDGAWWGFYKDGKQLPSGIDDTVISDGDKYEIKYEKA